MKRLQTNTTSKSSIFDRLKDNSIYNIDQFLDKIENGQDGYFELEITTNDFEGIEIARLRNQYNIDEIDNLRDLFKILKSMKKEFSEKEVSNSFKNIFGVEIDKSLFRKTRIDVSDFDKKQIIYKPVDFIRTIINKIDIKKINIDNFDLKKLDSLDQFEFKKFIKVFPIKESEEELALKNFLKQVKELMDVNSNKKEKEQLIYEFSKRISNLLIKTDIAAIFFKVKMNFFYKKDSFEITTQKLDSYFATKLEFHITKTNQFKLSSYKEFKNQFKEVLKKNLEDFYQEILLDSMKEYSMISLSGQKSLLLCNREALKQEMKLELKRILSLTPEEKILVSEIITEILEE
ncbi:MAG: hypothetical protein HXM94_01175 [Parvimonas micra]|uniref:Uncharacterized protein n=1 Tax=Parvimonas micra TaxID=33033 RepID=A0A930DZL6_9FIRM|nr:hypothetical protein [Parvimonas micra]MBF1306388.1 hypothetical protein [Parvimonas micra]